MDQLSSCLHPNPGWDMSETQASKNYIYKTRIQELTFLDFISIYQIYTGRDDEVIKSMLILPPRQAHGASR